MPDRTISTIPRVPLIELVKYKIEITTATIIRTTLSELPMFFSFLNIVNINYWFEKLILDSKLQ